ncbi:MAG: Gfo/Idh/MocA family oxidoreductase [Anaerolineae bacterium]|nr:Gfo/Idh/MocA family oxidoreductase [Anaerolineae bacterium]
MTPPIRWGMIGAGSVTEVKSGPGLQKARNSALVAVMRRDGALAQEYAARHGIARGYDDADALIHDPEVNAIYIATPPHVHMDYTRRAAAAGKPVYVEKPMALDHAECAAMIAACQQAGVPLFVAYYRRALARFLKIKELVDSGAVGEVRAVTVTLHQPPQVGDLDRDHLPWRVNPAIAGGGHFVDLASHMLDFLDFVLGPVRAVAGFAANQAGLYPAEDLVSGAWTFESGVQGSGLWCFTSQGKIDRTEIIGSAGTLTYSTFDAAPVRLETAEGAATFEIGYPEHVQQPLIQMVVDDLIGAGTCPSTGISAARTTWVMDRMLAGYRAAQSKSRLYLKYGKQDRDYDQ